MYSSDGASFLLVRVHVRSRQYTPCPKKHTRRVRSSLQYLAAQTIAQEAMSHAYESMQWIMEQTGVNHNSRTWWDTHSPVQYNDVSFRSNRVHSQHKMAVPESSALRARWCPPCCLPASALLPSLCDALWPVVFEGLYACPYSGLHVP